MKKPPLYQLGSYHQWHHPEISFVFIKKKKKGQLTAYPIHQTKSLCEQGQVCDSVNSCAIRLRVFTGRVGSVVNKLVTRTIFLFTSWVGSGLWKKRLTNPNQTNPIKEGLVRFGAIGSKDYRSGSANQNLSLAIPTIHVIQGSP